MFENAAKINLSLNCETEIMLKITISLALRFPHSKVKLKNYKKHTFLKY